MNWTFGHIDFSTYPAYNDQPLGITYSKEYTPYLSPVPFRGKRNESSYIVNILQKVAEVFSISEEDVARITTESAQKLFNLY